MGSVAKRTCGGTGKLGTLRTDPMTSGVERGRCRGLPFKHVQLVGGRVSQRPHVRCGGQDKVEAENGGELPSDPVDGLHYAGPYVPSGEARFRRDECEKALAVRLSQHQVHHAELIEALIKLLQTVENTVVREKPPVLLERVRIGHGERAGAGVPNMGQERGALQVPRFAGESVILPRRQRLFGYVRPACRIKGTYAGAVGLASALHGEAVRRIQQPEGGTHRPWTGMEPEEPTHMELPFTELVVKAF